jgi:transposase
MQSDIIKKLKELDLTEGEARVYLALLNGESRKSGIIRKSGVSPSIIDEILKKLAKKGLASFIEIDGKMYFYANDPEILLENLERKRIIADKLVSILKKRKGESVFFARVYEGLHGLKNMLKEVEKEEFEKNKSNEWLAMGVTTYKNTYFNRFWIHWHHKIRPRYNVRAKFIFSERNTSYFKMIKKAPLTTVKWIPLFTPSCITTIGETVLIMKYAEPPYFILIKNKEVADTFKEIFKFLWENC